MATEWLLCLVRDFFHPPYVLHQQHEVINGVPEAEKLGITFASQGDRCN